MNKSEVVLFEGLAPGDLGWVIKRHGEVNAEQFGWNQEFEILVGEIALAFAKNNNPRRERAWIAKANGKRLGCLFLVEEDTATAKLRILLVDPAAQGLGLGKTLVLKSLQFAKEVGYVKAILWTNES